MGHTPVLEVSFLKTPIHFCLVGGDARQLSLRTLLARDGHTVTTLAISDSPTALSPLRQANCVVLPIPATDQTGALYAPLCPTPISAADVLDILRPGQLLFGGKISETTHSQAAERGLLIRDLLLREEFSIANAVPTAEGALQLAMERLPITIQQSRILIVGFGRIGQCTAQRFHALGAHVDVCARSPAQLALAENMGCNPIPLSRLGTNSIPFDLVINTVPTPILTAAHLKAAQAPLLLELASPPGGFELTAVQDLGLRLISAQGLPGKVAPVTAARIIQTTLYRALEELNF